MSTLAQPFSTAPDRLSYVPPKPETPREINMIEDSLKYYDLKPDEQWGFVIYRVAYGKHTDALWARMLALLSEQAKNSLQLYGKTDSLAPRYKPVVMDDQARFEGATSQEIRDHFRLWAADEVALRLATPPTELEKESLRQSSYPEPYADDWGLGTRYNFCLFVDDVCLEPLDRMSMPVVKLLWKQWLPGTLEDEGEEYTEVDVGWTYLHVVSHVDVYGVMCDSNNWYDEYVIEVMSGIGRELLSKIEEGKK